MFLTTGDNLTRGASPGLVFLVLRKSEREARAQGGISIVVGGTPRGEVGTKRYPVRFPAHALALKQIKTTYLGPGSI